MKNKDNRGNKLMFALVCVLIASSGIMLVLGQYTLNVPSSGSIIKVTGLEAYQDAALTVPLTNINWGTLNAGETKTVIAYIKNIGNNQVTLICTIQNVNPPPFFDYATFSWDANNTVLAAHASLLTTFTLAISLNIVDITNFSFDISLGIQ